MSDPLSGNRSGWWDTADKTMNPLGYDFRTDQEKEKYLKRSALIGLCTLGIAHTFYAVAKGGQYIAKLISERTPSSRHGRIDAGGRSVALPATTQQLTPQTQRKDLESDKQQIKQIYHALAQNPRQHNDRKIRSWAKEITNPAIRQATYAYINSKPKPANAGAKHSAFIALESRLKANYLYPNQTKLQDLATELSDSNEPIFQLEGELLTQALNRLPTDSDRISFLDTAQAFVRTNTKGLS